jgi:hypothetical protein
MSNHLSHQRLAPGILTGKNRSVRLVCLVCFPLLTCGRKHVILVLTFTVKPGGVEASGAQPDTDQLPLASVLVSGLLKE